MASTHRSDSDRCRRNAAEDSRSLRPRFDSRRELRHGRDALPPAARHGRDMEPATDARREPGVGGRNACGRHPMEFFAGPRHRPPAAVAAAVRDLRRGRAPGERHGRGDHPRLSRRRSFVADAGGRVPQALHRLQLPGERPRSDTGIDSDRHGAGVLPADICRRGKSRRPVGHGELRRGERHSRPCESVLADRRPPRRAWFHGPCRLRLGGHQAPRDGSPRVGHRKGCDAPGRAGRNRHEHGAFRLQLQRSPGAARERRRHSHRTDRRGRFTGADDEGPARAVRRSDARDPGADCRRLRRLAAPCPPGGARVDHSVEKRRRRAAARARLTRARHRTSV